MIELKVKLSIIKQLESNSMKWMLLSSLFLIFILCSCGQREMGPLDSVFSLLEKKSPNDLIAEFKAEPLDSIIIQNSKYDKIFIDAANDVMNDSIQATILRDYFKSQGTDLVGIQVKWTIIAAFHKYLNGIPYDIKEILDEMIELGDEINEKMYGRLENEKD